jgi:hypothetical protein
MQLQPLPGQTLPVHRPYEAPIPTISPPLPSPVPFQNATLYIYTDTPKPAPFDTEGGGSMYLRNVGNIVLIRTVEQPKNGININLLRYL